MVKVGNIVKDSNGDNWTIIKVDGNIAFYDKWLEDHSEFNCFIAQFETYGEGITGFNKNMTLVSEGKPQRLTCCCCGDIAVGRQWWNRDKGFGLCTNCVGFCQAEGSNDCYGIEGVHYNLSADVAASFSEIKRKARDKLKKDMTEPKDAKV